MPAIYLKNNPVLVKFCGIQEFNLFQYIHKLYQLRMQPENSRQRSGSQKSHRPETTNLDTRFNSAPESQFLLNKEDSLTMTNLIAAQNKKLAESNSTLQKELVKVSSLSEYLVGQNRKLRLHYYNRTEDISNIVKTMQINAAQNINQQEHRIHLFKQSNYQIFKKIQYNAKNIDNIQKQMNKTNRELECVHEQTITLENNVLNPLKARIAQKYNSSHINSLEQQQEECLYDEKILMEAVNDLLVQTNKLRKREKQRKLFVGKQKVENHQQKEDYKNKVMHALKTLQQLRKEMEDLKRKVQRNDETILQQNRRNEQKSEQLRLIQAEHQEKTVKLVAMSHKRQNNQRIFNKIREQIGQLELQKEQVEQKRQNLQKLIKNTEKGLKEKVAKHEIEKERKKEQHRQKIKILKQNIKKIESDASQQIKKLQTLTQQKHKQIQELMFACSIQESYENQYKEVVQKMDNPKDEIQRLQMRLLLKGKRVALEGLNNNV